MTPLKPEIRVFSTPADVAAAVAEEVAAAAESAVRESGRFTIALAGGSTPKALYALLAAEPFAARVPWDATHVFFGDERCVPPDHADSNFQMAREALLSKVPLPPDNIHRIEGERPCAEAAEAYERALEKFFWLRKGEVPRIDLVLLGMGADGHTASLFPGTAAVREAKRLVVGHHVEKLNADRVTLTPPTINAAAEVIFVVAGADKADALQAVVDGAREPDRYPAQTVHPTRGFLRFWVDAAAGAKLAPREG